MAYDKVIDSDILEAEMTATANAIREKTGRTEQIPWEVGQGFASAIAAISGEVKDATVSLNQSLDTSASIIYEQDGKFVTTSVTNSLINKVNISVKVGSILLFTTPQRSKSGSYPPSPIITVNGATYKSDSVAYSYRSGTSTVQTYVRYERILFLITEPYATIDVSI